MEFICCQGGNFELKHFNQIEGTHLFLKQPEPFHKHTDKETLAMALGATMYTPATRKDIASTIINKKYKPLTSFVICLEDSIADTEVEIGEANLLKQMEQVDQAVKSGEINEEDIPLLFIRVRTPEHLEHLEQHLDTLHRITGFSLPKFESSNALAYLTVIERMNQHPQAPFYAMPILESPSIIYQETRLQELTYLKKVCDQFQSFILNIRVGGTDFSSAFGIRRGVDFTIYDVSVIADCLKDILNFFSRATDDYVVSGPVWEYFPDKTRVLKPQLRQTPFSSKEDRAAILGKELDGLIREVVLDKANGFVGKTIIHPSHLPFVNALQAVTYEEYMDACQVLQNAARKGVEKSTSGNKMNETKPHTKWATRIMKKSKVYGVLKNNVNYVELF